MMRHHIKEKIWSVNHENDRSYIFPVAHIYYAY